MSWSQGKSAWQEYLAAYPTTIELLSARAKPASAPSLLALDTTVWSEISPSVSSRAPSPYITHAELCTLVSWKLRRGTWRPRLQSLAASNTPAAVTDASARAFRALRAEDNDGGKRAAAGAALDALCELRGVGPATASLVLAVGAPDVAFMADELLDVVPALGGKREYTKKAFTVVLQAAREKAEELGGDWNAGMVERATFAWRRGEGGTEKDGKAKKDKEKKEKSAAQTSGKHTTKKRKVDDEAMRVDTGKSEKSVARASGRRTTRKRRAEKDSKPTGTAEPLSKRTRSSGRV